MFSDMQAMQEKAMHQILYEQIGALQVSSNNDRTLRSFLSHMATPKQNKGYAPAPRPHDEESLSLASKSPILRKEVIEAPDRGLSDSFGRDPAPAPKDLKSSYARSHSAI